MCVADRERREMHTGFWWETYCRERIQFNLYMEPKFILLSAILEIILAS